MKQAGDRFTKDMFPENDGAKQPKYRVHLILDNGTELVWDQLTRAQARALHKVHDQNFNPIRSSADITRFGWEEMK